jgi:hypothetical protein
VSDAPETDRSGIGEVERCTSGWKATAGEGAGDDEPRAGIGNGMRRREEW